MTSTADQRDDNEVFLRGTLATEPEARVLPSGDELLAFRVTVPRPPGETGRVDSIDCAVLAPKVRTCLARAVPGDRLELSGSLRRRFWRSPTGLGSRYEVLVTAARVPRRRRSGA